MKKIKTLITALALSIGAFAQTTLPTAWSFSTSTLPNGWTESSPNVYYASSGNTPPAYKFDSSGDLLTIFFASSPGPLSYYIAGNSFSGGTFLVQESVNGSAWTTLHSFSAPTTSYSPITDIPNAASRYIRFNYSSKVTGNIGLDDVVLSAAAATPAQEINVKYASATVINSGTVTFNSAVSTMSPKIFSIENIGTATALTISSATITGVNASEFVLSTVPASIAAASASNLVIDFTPTAAGARYATLAIANDDADENPYIINLIGIGGNYYLEPTNQATNLTFSNIKSYRSMAAFTAASGSPTGYLILKKESGSAITDTPVDGTVYQRGDAIGTSKVLYIGSSTSIGVNNIYAGLPYQLSVFAYNGSGVYINYLTSTTLTGGFTALGSMQPALEYSSLNVTNSNFLTSLSAQIYPHQSTFYSNYGQTMIKLFAARDTAGGQKVVTCVYSSENYVYSEPFAFGYMSREHSYCHQWMPTNPADGSAPSPNNVERKEFSDQHHLFPTNQDDVNAVRSNYPMGEIVTPQSSYMLSKRGVDVNGNTVFEPRASHKGDFARAIMYMATCYNGQNDAFGAAQNWKLKKPISTTITWGQDQNILKKWHFQDLPDSYEISRNDFLDSLQGNRNPFIDSVRYACYIDFSNMTHVSAPTYTTGVNSPCYVAVGIKENIATQFEYVLAPNPTSGEFYLMIDAKIAEKFNLDITDVSGRIVYKRNVDVVNGFNNVIVNDLKLQSGIYFVNLNYKNEKITRKLIIQ